MDLEDLSYVISHKVSASGVCHASKPSMKVPKSEDRCAHALGSKISQIYNSHAQPLWLFIVCASHDLVDLCTLNFSLFIGEFPSCILLYKMKQMHGTMV
jgi:hypothetical protein